MENRNRRHQPKTQSLKAGLFENIPTGHRGKPTLAILYTKVAMNRENTVMTHEACEATRAPNGAFPGKSTQGLGTYVGTDVRATHACTGDMDGVVGFGISHPQP